MEGEVRRAGLCKCHRGELGAQLGDCLVGLFEAALVQCAHPGQLCAGREGETRGKEDEGRWGGEGGEGGSKLGASLAGRARKRTAGQMCMRTNEGTPRPLLASPSPTRSHHYPTFHSCKRTEQR